MKRLGNTMGVLAAALLIAAGLFGCGLSVGSQETPTAAAADADEHGLVEPEEAAEQDRAAAASKSVTLTPDQIAKYEIETATAGPGKLANYLKLPGEVRLNSDHVARVVPRLPGLVTEIRKNLGDEVAAGETVAVIESRDLAVATSGLLAAREKLALAKITFERERSLWEKKISAEQDYLDAKQALGEVEIDVRAAEQQLLALGLNTSYLDGLSNRSPGGYTRFEVISPVAGTVIEKHVVIGDSLQTDTVLFVVADLQTVWIDLSVSAKDIPKVAVGQKVEIATDTAVPPAEGKISYVGPTVEQDNRTALARVVLPNETHEWKPGTFVTGLIAVSEREAPILVPKDAVQQLGTEPSVFVKKDGAFVPRVVVVGQTNEKETEVISGLAAGEEYAAKGTFILKAELEKSAAEEE